MLFFAKDSCRAFKKEPVNEFQCQKFVQLSRVVSVPFEMAVDHHLEPFSFDIGPGERPLVEQDLLDISGQNIPVPNTKMECLVPPQEETFEPERREGMVKLR